MTIRFLETTPSEHPDFPFVAGQIIYVDAPSRFLLKLIKDKRAQVIRTDDTERAIAPETEQPEPTRGRKRELRRQ